MPLNRWRESEAPQAGDKDLLIYRSRLLGADRAVCNIFGGNTSAKVKERDFRDRPVLVLWVKGSGSDLATLQASDLAGLRLDDILPLLERETLSDEEMIDYLQRCLLHPGMPRPSIETLLHAFIPARHVDHTHPDAILSLATNISGEEHVRRLYGRRAVWIPYQRPGFALSKEIALALREHPEATCVVLEKHGLVTWGETSRECYEQTIRVIQEAEDYIASRGAERRILPSVRVPSLSPAERKRIATELLPVLRGAVSSTRHQIILYDDSQPVLSFLARDDAATLTQIGSACPDHVIHTKHWPLFVPWAHEGLPELKEKLRRAVAAYRERYENYFRDHQSGTEQMFDSAPRIILIPELGLFASGRDVALATVARDLYHRAIAVMEGAQALGGFVSLTPAEAFAIEYWPLELYKLRRRPPERELAGRVAVVTGGASGIGRATALQLAREGAHVAIFDINTVGAEETARTINEQYGTGRSLALGTDVTSEEQVRAAFESVIAAYGGVDIVVSNAGIAHAAPITETDSATWCRLHNVLVYGYFLVAREAFRIWQEQGIGGSLIIVASKNALVGGKNAAAYSAAKAAEVQLARCLAEEGGPYGIRVNTVCPDAVLRGSSIWDSDWRRERARTYGITPDRLEEYYRERTTLKVNIYPEDVAEAIFFFASDRSRKTTGGILTVDGGSAAAYVR